MSHLTVIHQVLDHDAQLMLVVVVQAFWIRQVRMNSKESRTGCCGNKVIEMIAPGDDVAVCFRCKDNNKSLFEWVLSFYHLRHFVDYLPRFPVLSLQGALNSEPFLRIPCISNIFHGIGWSFNIANKGKDKAVSRSPYLSTRRYN